MERSADLEVVRARTVAYQMGTRGEKGNVLTKRIKDILWFMLGAVIGLFSLIGLYVVALYVL